MRDILKKLIIILKKKWWYLLLLCGSSLFVIINHNHIYQLQKLNTKNLIFIIWIILLLLPLFSELEFLGIRIKKEVQKATGEIKESVQALQTQITQFQYSNYNATINFGNAILPSEQQIENLSSNIEKSNATTESENENESDDNVYLFQVRLKIETTLRELTEKIGYIEKMPIIKMIDLLNRAELLDGMTCDLLRQVLKIANRGVHGEIISPQYITFVKKAYPEMLSQLKEASSHLKYITCSKCNFSGYSTYYNVCPKCGFISDDE